LNTTHYIIIIVAICSFYWMVISLIEIIKNKNRLRAKKETWGKLNEVSERRKAEKNVKVWESLGNTNKEK